MSVDPRTERRERVVLVALVAFGLFNTAAYIALRYFVFGLYSVPTNSMAPTLQAGDHFIAYKPIDRQHLQRGEIVTFYLPDKETEYVKRIVAIPGDTVQMRDGVLVLNGQPVMMEAAGRFQVSEAPGLSAYFATRLVEHLAPGEAHYIIDINTNGSGDNTREMTLPPERYFMLGDNRDNSNDSRFNVGFVPAERIIGRLVLVYWNTNLHSLTGRRP
jgi:signal peptidase I